MPANQLEVRRQRSEDLREIFAELDRQGRKRTWLAAQLGMSPKRLWNYEHGFRRPPDGFSVQAAATLGIVARTDQAPKAARGPPR